MIVLPVRIEFSIYHVKLNAVGNRTSCSLGKIESEEISRPVFERILNSTFPANAGDLRHGGIRRGAEEGTFGYDSARLILREHVGRQVRATENRAVVRRQFLQRPI